MTVNTDPIIMIYMTKLLHYDYDDTLISVMLSRPRQLIPIVYSFTCTACFSYMQLEMLAAFCVMCMHAGFYTIYTLLRI